MKLIVPSRVMKYENASSIFIIPSLIFQIAKVSDQYVGEIDEDSCLVYKREGKGRKYKVIRVRSKNVFYARMTIPKVATPVFRRFIIIEYYINKDRELEKIRVCPLEKYLEKHLQED